MNGRLLIRKGLTLIQVQLKALGKLIYSSEYERNRDVWYADQGDITLRLAYDALTENSMVFDLGGWQGGWASDIYSKYNCTIHVFEPVRSYAEFIKQRFKNNKKISVHQFGLGATNETLTIFIGDEGSSTVKNHNNRSEGETIEIKSIKNFLLNNDITTIDLIKINIEGGEYELLEYLIDQGLVGVIGNFQIQFHDFVDSAATRRERIRTKLRETHRLTYDYPFVWEGWARL